MAKKKVFISFDFDHDYHLKASLVGQSRLPDSSFAISDYSLKEPQPDSAWLSKAQQMIHDAEVVVVVLGPNTHTAPGVRKEVNIAKGYRKPIFQLRPQGTTYPEVPGAGEVYAWKWRNLKRLLS